MADKRTFEERWKWLLVSLIFDDPFSAELLSMLRVERNDAVGTMGVTVDGADMRLLYSRPFVESIPDSAVSYVLSHEMFHLALHHCTSRKPSDDKARARHNIASDLEVNSLIVENEVRRRPPTPMDGLHPEKFKLPPKLSLEQYLALLPPDSELQKSYGGNANGGAGDEDQQGGGGNDKDGEGAGDGEDVRNDHGGFDSHGGWTKQEDMVAEEMIRQKIRQMENHDRHWGRMAGDTKQRILEAQRSVIAWHKILRVMYGLVMPSRSMTHTFKKPNRRFGYPYTGFKREYIDRALLAWDSSGSIHDAELSRFLSETNKMAEVVPVDVVIFDHKLQTDIMPFRKRMKAIDVPGRGGTSFKEPFELADEKRYKTLIMLTDGCAAPIPRPRYVKDVVWVIVGGGKPPVDWGRVVNIDTQDGRLVAKAA